MEPISVAASVITLLATSRAIAVVFRNVLSTVRDAPKGIENLHQEHNSVQAVIESVRKMVESDQENNPEITMQIRSIVGYSQTTLDELNGLITTLVPQKLRNGRRAAIQIRCRYFFNEKQIQAIMYRLRAQRRSLALILNVSSNADSTLIKKELLDIRKSLESYLVSLRADKSNSETSGNSVSPGSTTSSSSERRSSSIFTPNQSKGNVSEITSDADDAQPLVSDLARRFDTALAKGKTIGPAGENVRRRTQAFNAQTTASIGSAMQRRDQGCSADSLEGGTPIKSSGAPFGKIQSLIQGLAAKEAVAPGLTSKESAAAAQALAKAYQDADQLETALEYYHLALTAREFVLGPKHPTTLNTIDIIAAVFEIQLRWQEALEYYQRSLAGRENNDALGPTHPSILATTTRVARVLSKTGELEVALQEYQTILVKYQELPNGGSTAALAIQVDMAKIHLQMRSMSEGLPLAEVALLEYRTLLDAREQKFGPAHRLTREAREAIEEVENVIREARGTPEDSPKNPFENDLNRLPDEPGSPFPEIAAYEKKLEEMRAIHGIQHPETLIIMCSLGEAFERHEQLEPAISWYLEALRGQEIVYGRLHPATLRTVHELGVCYLKRDEPNTALMYLTRALQGRSTKLAENHPHTLGTILQIAEVHKTLVDLKKAKEFLERGIDGSVVKNGPKHPTTLSAKFSLAKIYCEEGAYDAAMKLHEEVLQDRMERDGLDHPSVLSSKVHLATVYRAQGDTAKAIPLLREAFDGQEKKYGDLHSTTTSTASQLAAAYWATEEWREALDFYFITLKGIQNENKKNATAGTVIMTNIALCYRQLDMQKNALSWLEKVLKIYETELGVDNEKTIEAALDVAQANSTLEKFDEAMEHYQRALTAKEKVLPATDKTIIDIIFRLGFVTWKNGQSERSLVWCKRLVDFGASVELESRLITLRRMGHIYTAQGKNTEALDVFQQIMEEAKAKLDEDHWLPRNVSIEIQNLYVKIHQEIDTVGGLEAHRELIRQMLERNEPMGVRLLLKLGEVHEKQHMQHEALALREEALDAIQCLPELPDLVGTRHEAISGIADAHLALYNNKAAITYLQILVDSEEDESWKLGALIRMGGAHDSQSNFDLSIASFKQALREIERESGLDTINALCCVRKIGTLNLRLGNTQQALQWTQRALAGFQRSPDADAKKQEFTTLSILCSIQLELGELDGALQTQKACAEGFETELGPQDEKTLAAALTLAEIYDALEYEEAALWWYTKAVKGYQGILSTTPAQASKAMERMQELQGRGVTVSVTVREV